MPGFEPVPSECQADDLPMSHRDCIVIALYVLSSLFSARDFKLPFVVCCCNLSNKTILSDKLVNLQVNGSCLLLDIDPVGSISIHLNKTHLVENYNWTFVYSSHQTPIFLLHNCSWDRMHVCLIVRLLRMISCDKVCSQQKIKTKDRRVYKHVKLQQNCPKIIEQLRPISNKNQFKISQFNINS